VPKQGSKRFLLVKARYATPQPSLAKDMKQYDERSSSARPNLSLPERSKLRPGDHFEILGAAPLPVIVLVREYWPAPVNLFPRIDLEQP
jgi:hypothetical protein